MIELYHIELCPYCVKVRIELEKLGMIGFRDLLLKGSEQREELLKLGGKHQVPFLVDNENDVAMYESDEIIAYLHSISFEKTV